MLTKPQTSRTGVALPASATFAGGRAILCGTERDALLRLYPSPTLTEHPHSKVSDRGKLFTVLDKVAEAGYSVQSDESEPGISTVSVPILISHDLPRFALSVVPNDHTTS